MNKHIEKTLQQINKAQSAGLVEYSDLLHFTLSILELYTQLNRGIPQKLRNKINAYSAKVDLALNEA